MSLQRIFITITVTLLFCSGTNAQTPSFLWSFDTKDASFGQTAAGDIDGDGKLELVFGCYRNDSSVYALNAEDGSLLWKYSTRWPGAHGCNDVAPLIADVNDDGSMEVIVPSSCNPTTFCFDGKTGAVLWSTRTRGSDSPPTIADIDKDDTLEILHGEFGGYVICLNAVTGMVEWELAVDVNSWIQTAPTLLDADGDGELDFVVATWNAVEGDTNTVRAYRCIDRTLLWSRPLDKYVYHGTAVADLDKDGKAELALGDYTGKLSVLNAEDGSELWTVPSAGNGHYIGAPVSIADLDGDGWCEVVYVSWYKLFAYTHDGDMFWEYDIPGYANAFRGAALTDVDGDDLPDAVFGTGKGKLIAVSGINGDELWSIDLAADYGDERFTLDHAPVIADFDGDDDLDVFIVGGHAQYPEIENGFGRAYAYDIGRGAGPPWLMFQQNVRRTSSLCPGTGTAVEQTPAHSPLAISIYPRPTDGKLTVQTSGLKQIVVFDSGGRILEKCNAESEELTLSLTAYPSGTYFLLIISKTSAAFRMVIKE